MLISILLTICIVSASFVALRLVTSSVAEHHQTIYVEPAYVQVTPCTNFTVEVKVRDVVNLYGYEFHLYWDCNLWCVDCELTPPWIPNLIVKNECNNTGKYYWCAVAAMVPAPPFTGTTTLARLTFHCEGPGNCTLSLQETGLYNDLGEKITHNVENGFVVQEERPIYRYKVKFECRWEIEVVGPCDPTVPSQRIPVETLITTHINVYNPDHTAEVIGFKYFVQCLKEPPHPWIPEPIGGHTMKNWTFVIPPNKGFEIDCDDVSSWPSDPHQPPLPPWPCELKGFVVIESLGRPLEVVAVYNKKSADIVNKITFKIWPILPPIDTLIGKLKFYEPYELSVPLPYEPSNLTLEEVVKKELGLLPPPPPEPEDIDIEIESTTTFFDFLQCVTKERIVFTLRPTNLLVQKFLNETWPPEERPPGFEWPDWIWPCRIRTILVKPSINWTEDPNGLRHGTVLDDGNYLLSAFRSELTEMGIPNAIITQIMSVLRIEIIDVDVGEGVGASIDVEYIQPEIIPVPVP